jgi:cell division protein FtsQ
MSSRVSRTFLFVALPLALGMVGLVFGGLELREYLLTASVFRVKDVEVATKGAANREMILKRAAIASNENIFSLDLEAVRKRVEEEPWVKSATVVRALPNKIQIYYEPQTPHAILGGEALYYLNRQGVPFYKIQKGDSLKYPLLQLEGRVKSRSLLVDRVKIALDLLEELNRSKLFKEKDLGEIAVRMEAEDGAAPYVLTLRFPPQELAKKQQTGQFYSVSFGETDLKTQVNRWEGVVRHLAQQGRNPRLIRLELGKKVVVKVDR